MADLTIQCSFCGRPEDQVWRLVAGPGVYICSDCLGVSLQILAGEASERLKVVSRQPDGSIQRSEYGPLPKLDPNNQGQSRWFRQCQGCGAWNIGVGVSHCLDCGAVLAAT